MPPPAARRADLHARHLAAVHARLRAAAPFALGPGHGAHAHLWSPARRQHCLLLGETHDDRPAGRAFARALAGWDAVAAPTRLLLEMPVRDGPLDLRAAAARRGRGVDWAPPRPPPALPTLHAVQTVALRPPGGAPSPWLTVQPVDVRPPDFKPAFYAGRSADALPALLGAHVPAAAPDAPAPLRAYAAALRRRAASLASMAPGAAAVQGAAWELGSEWVDLEALSALAVAREPYVVLYAGARHVERLVRRLCLDRVLGRTWRLLSAEGLPPPAPRRRAAGGRG